MSKENNLTDLIRDIANGIREKTNQSTKIDPQIFSTIISQIRQPDIKTNIASTQVSANVRLRPQLQSEAESSWVQTNGKREVSNTIASHQIGTDGTDTYYSYDTIQYKLDVETNTGIVIDGSGDLQEFYGSGVWSDNESIYYSYGKKHYKLTPELHKGSQLPTNYGTGLTDFSGGCIVKDGSNIYYMDGNKDFKLNGTTGEPIVGTTNNPDEPTITIENRSWVGLYDNNIYYSYTNHHYKLESGTTNGIDMCNIGNLGNFYGFSCGTDGENAYVSDGTQRQYKLPKGSNTGVSMQDQGNGLIPEQGQYIGNLNGNIYYSGRYCKDSVEYNGQFVLDLTTNTWVKNTMPLWPSILPWSEFNSLYIGTDGTDIYYSCENEQYILDKQTAIWYAIDFPVAINGTIIGSDNTNIYCNVGGYDGGTYIFDKTARTWAKIIIPTPYNLDTSQYIGSDGADIYYSKNGTQLKFDKTAKAGDDATDNGKGKSVFDRSYVWSDGINTYYSKGSTNKVLDRSTNAGVSKTGSTNIGTSFRGDYIGTDGSNIYYSNSQTQLKLENDIYTGSDMKNIGQGLKIFNGTGIGSDGTIIYYSSGSKQYKLEPNSTTGTTVQWSGLESFEASYIWKDLTNNIYYSNSSQQYILDSANSAGIELDTDYGIGNKSFYGNNVWTDGENIYYSAREAQYKLEADGHTWSDMGDIGQGLSRFFGNSIGQDNSNIYYSGSAQQYILNKATFTGLEMPWRGLANFNGNAIGTDTSDIYCSEGSKQYILNKSTHTGTSVVRMQVQGKYIGTDGSNIYYSHGSTHYVLDKATSTWSTKTGTGLSNFQGDYIWTDGNNIYYSNGSSQQYRLSYQI